MPVGVWKYESVLDEVLRKGSMNNEEKNLKYVMWCIIFIFEIKPCCLKKETDCEAFLDIWDCEEIAYNFQGNVHVTNNH